MPPTPSPAQLAAAPLEWWQNVALFSPAAVLLAALIAALINWRILRQRTRADATALEQKRVADQSALEQKSSADSRAEWWRRAQWALDSSLSDDPDRAKLGLGIMTVLASNPPGPDEVRIITIAWEDPLQVAEGDGDSYESEMSGDGPQGEYDMSVSVPAPIREADPLGGVDDRPKPGDNGATTEEKE